MDQLTLQTPGITEEQLDALLVENGANYTVATVPTPNPFGTEPTGFFTSYRTDTKKIFAQGLKQGWTPIQNRDGMRILCELSKVANVKLKSFFLFGGGREIVAQIDLGTHNLSNGDRIGNFISMINGHDGGHSYSIFETPYRYWCKNMISRSIKQATSNKSILSIRHSASSKEKLEVLMKSIQIAQQDFRQSMAIYAKLLNTHVNRALAYDIIDGLYPAVDKEQKRACTIRMHKLLDIYGRYNSADQGRTPVETAWNLYNAIQGHIQHYGNKDSEAHQKSVLIGNDANRAAKAMGFILGITASQHLADALTIEEKTGIAIF